MAPMKLGPGWIAVGGVCSALAAGCGSSSSPGTGVAQACADVALARCSQGSECTLPEGTTGTGFNILENYGEDPQTCIARQTLACTDGLIAPGTGNSPTKVEACVAEFGGYTCQKFFDNQPPTECAVTGSHANGASCTFNGQCLSGYCQGTKTSVCGACADPPAVGADCSASVCWQGQRCLASTQKCAAVVAMNGVCDATHPCDRGFVCFGADAATSTSGTCLAAGTHVGQSCGGTLPACDPTLGLYCGGPAGAKTCMQVVYGTATGSPDGGADASSAGKDAGPAGADAGAGVPCGVLPSGTHVGCVAGGCYTATGVASGTDLGACKPFAADNAACDSTVGPDCMPPARCVATGGGSTDGGSAGTCLVPTASMCPSP
jgi:hypothetical protein